MRVNSKHIAVSGKRIVMLLGLLAAACSPIVDNRGHSLQALDLSQITIGTSQREDVKAILGSPSLESDYGNTWYYVTMQKETSGVLSPEITRQDITEISFDEAGTVSDIHKYSKKDGKPVELVEKSTPSAGHSLTFIEQLLGNVGRFGTPGRQIDPRRGY